MKQMKKLVQASTNQTEGPRLLYSRKEAARQLSISIRTLDDLIAKKELIPRRIRRRVSIPHGVLVRFARTDHFGPII